MYSRSFIHSFVNRFTTRSYPRTFQILVVRWTDELPIDWFLHAKRLCIAYHTISDERSQLVWFFFFFFRSEFFLCETYIVEENRRSLSIQRFYFRPRIRKGERNNKQSNCDFVFTCISRGAEINSTINFAYRWLWFGRKKNTNHNVENQWSFVDYSQCSLEWHALCEYNRNQRGYRDRSYL